jgi:hypothetical protein
MVVLEIVVAHLVVAVEEHRQSVELHLVELLVMVALVQLLL